MKSKASRKPRAASKRISSWDDALFDPADLVRDVGDLADHYEGKKKLTLRTFTVVAPVPRFSPAEIVELREARKLSRPLFAANPQCSGGHRPKMGVRGTDTVRGRAPAVASYEGTPEALLQITALSKTANREPKDTKDRISRQWIGIRRAGYGRRDPARPNNELRSRDEVDERQAAVSKSEESRLS